MEKKTSIILGFVYLLLTIFSASENTDTEKKYWPQWRGSNASGINLIGNSPAKCDEKNDIKWKIPLPGKGHAAPIIWGDLIFISTAVDEDKEVKSKDNFSVKSSKICKFMVLALNRVLEKPSGRQQ